MSNATLKIITGVNRSKNKCGSIHCMASTYCWTRSDVKLNISKLHPIKNNITGRGTGKSFKCRFKNAPTVQIKDNIRMISGSSLEFVMNIFLINSCHVLVSPFLNKVALEAGESILLFLTGCLNSNLMTLSANSQTLKVGNQLSS